MTDTPTEGMKREHDLKTWPGPFADVKAARKPFEFRFNDRDFRVGDTLRLREWSPDTGAYTGDTLQRDVGYIFHGGQFGIPDGYVIMALADGRPQGEEGLRETLEALGYQRVFNAIGDAVEWKPHRSFGISVAKFIAALSNQGKASS